jgi:hypothetical protein
MARPRLFEDRYAGRPTGIVPKNYSLWATAVDLLAEMAPSKRGHGEFISALIMAEYARWQERQKAQGREEDATESDWYEPTPVGV